ncbi:ankyrin repeat-containing domain protein [Aspergillus aurantiobrunneus]
MLREDHSLEPITALQEACEANNLNAAREVAASADSDDLNKALCQACRMNKVIVIQVLLEQPNLDINAAPGGDTPLFLAALSCNPDLVRLLLDHGADPAIKSRERTPLHALAMHSRGHSNDDPNSNAKQRRCVVLLVEAGCDHGADPNATDIDGGTAMHFFSNVGTQAKLFRLFMSHGARLDTHNGLGDLSLFHPYVSDWKLTDSNGNTLLRAAATRRPHYRYAEVLRVLIARGANVNTQDHQGNGGDTMLHRMAANLATVYEEKDVLAIKKLVALGVSPTGTNHKGQTPLHKLCILPVHLAATISEPLHRLRDSNIIGLLLHHYASRNRMAMVNARCQNGRTPLHEACRSGRLESVDLLVKAGADAHAQDAKSNRVLDACSEFTKEDRLWSLSEDSRSLFGTLVAGGVLSTDESRPRDPNSGSRVKHRYDWSEVWSENDTVSIGPIIRLLVAHGAELESGRGYSPNILDTAVVANSEEMLIELERLAEEKGYYWSHRRDFRLDLMKLRSRQFPALLDEALQQHVVGEYDMGHLILNRHHDELVQALERNIDSIRADSSGIESDIAGVFLTLARYGYHDLFLAWETSSGQRQLPNLEVIKVISRSSNTDLNVVFTAGLKVTREIPCLSKAAANRQYKPRDTILRYLARGGHWHGANPNARDKQGKTPLFSTVRAEHLGEYAQKEITQTLLEGGADPNIPANCGYTPLAMAAHDHQLAQLLLQHGARPSSNHPMEIYSALGFFNGDLVNALLDIGIDCNTTRVVPNMPDFTLHPLHYISMEYFNDAHAQDHAIEMVKILLGRGADPFLSCGGQRLILHEVFATGGIIQPFLDMDTLDMERRDGLGRTLLLAAACCKEGTNSYTYEISFLPSTDTRFRPATYLEVDDDGDNVLHCLVQHESTGKNEHRVREYQRTISVFLEEAPEQAEQRNNDGSTPWDIANEMQHAWALDVLRRTAGHD